MDLAANRLQAAASFSKELAVSHIISRPLYHPRLLPPLSYQSGGLFIADSIFRCYAKLFPNHKIGIVYYHSDSIRSFCRHSYGFEGGEFAEHIHYHPDFGQDLNRNANLMIHEVLHMFGAMDLYFSDPEFNVRVDWLLDYSVMSIYFGECHIDPVTSYLIGWTPTLRDELLFIVKTKPLFDLY